MVAWLLVDGYISYLAWALSAILMVMSDGLGFSLMIICSYKIVTNR